MIESNGSFRRPSPRRSMSLWLWAIGLLLLPIYVFASGRPQPSHLVLAAAAVAAYVEFRSYDQRYRQLVRAMGFLVLVITVVTLVWSMFASSDVTLFPSLFALFNFLVLRTALVLHSHLRKRFLTVTAVVIAVDLLAMAIYSLAFGDQAGFRATGLFNNPNQLAYFAVCGASALMAIDLVVPLDWRLQLPAYAATAYLLGIANSKAGFLAMGVVAILVALRNPRVALVLTVALIALVATTQVGSTTYEDARFRIVTAQQDDTVEGRGYDLITERPGYLVTGAGEGYRDRFGRTMEIHSTLGTVTFAYGIVGLVAFAMVFVRVYQISGLAGLAVLVPAMAYGVAHNGLRFTPFWILVALAATIGVERRSPPDRQEALSSLEMAHGPLLGTGPIVTGT